MAEHSFIQDSDTLRLTYQDGATVLEVVKLCTKGLSQELSIGYGPKGLLCGQRPQALCRS